jgi:hypothetical protein
MPFVPFTKKSATGPARSSDLKAPADPTTAPTFSKQKFGRNKRKTGKVAPAQKALMNPGGRALGGGGR